MRIVKTMTFDAAHYLDEDNDAPAYKRMHGHSFTLDVELEGEPNDSGWVADFGELTTALYDLREQLDHRLLNEVEGLERPTLENICRWVAARLSPDFPSLCSVRVARPSNGEACIYEL